MDTQETLKLHLQEWADFLKEDPNTVYSMLSTWSYKHWALFEYLELEPKFINEIGEFSNQDLCEEIEIADMSLVIYNDTEADDEFRESLTQLVEDCGCPNWLIPYVDMERLEQDSNRELELAYYDGRENEYNIDGEPVYIYRRN